MSYGLGWAFRGLAPGKADSVTRDRTTVSATLQGLIAVVLWAALAALTTYAGPIPPFQLAAMTFAAGTLVGLVYARATGEHLVPILRAVPAGAWALGVYGLLIFHACYFYALQKAPAIEVSLIIYLWPLLIVLASGLLPARLGGKGLRWWHVVGALMAFGGTVLILLGAATRPDFSGSASGYVAALAAALIWSSYSVASRIYRDVPSSAVIGSCAATAIGSTLLHLALEATVWPATPTAWAAVLALGLGPVGLAFYVWDRGMKHGNMQLLGAASYATPLLSTIILAALGLGQATGMLWIAAILVTAGALTAASDTLR
jgi:drug/metabolite transporter (DMT)-like permease